MPSTTIQYFEYEHLREDLQKVSKPIVITEIVVERPKGDEA